MLIRDQRDPDDDNPWNREVTCCNSVVGSRAMFNAAGTCRIEYERKSVS
jgi:hypothetical protein